jgi:isopentenyl phosphate kinase
MKIDVIIKFGGSAVTVKDQLETLKEEELPSAVDHVFDLCSKRRV